MAQAFAVVASVDSSLPRMALVVQVLAEYIITWVVHFKFSVAKGTDFMNKKSRLACYRYGV